MNKEIFGYCRISTPKQNIDRQERNILETKYYWLHFNKKSSGSVHIQE